MPGFSRILGAAEEAVLNIVLQKYISLEKNMYASLSGLQWSKIHVCG
jgi:hypothetical protein